MKKVLAFRHSLKDGPNNEIGPKGVQLAWLQGKAMSGYDFDTCAHGPLIRTAQTLGVMLAATGTLPSANLPVVVVEQFGSEALFVEMTVHPEFREKAKVAGNFRALLVCYPEQQVRTWALYCHQGLAALFHGLEDGQTAIAISHSPSLELAIWAARNFGRLPDDQAILEEMAGYDLYQYPKDLQILVNRKIPAPRLEVRLPGQ